TFDAEGRLLRTQTRIDDSVFGDMLVENRFEDYRDFGAVTWPASISQWQGGHAVLHLEVTAVTPAAATEMPPAPAGGAGPPGGPAAAEEGTVDLTPDIVVSLGAYQGVFVNQPDGIV